MGNIRAVVLTQMKSIDIRGHTNVLTPYQREAKNMTNVLTPHERQVKNIMAVRAYQRELRT